MTKRLTSVQMNILRDSCDLCKGQTQGFCSHDPHESMSFGNLAFGRDGHSPESFGSLRAPPDRLSIDRPVDYQTGQPDETARVINPAYRKLEQEIKSKAGSEATAWPGLPP